MMTAASSAGRRGTGRVALAAALVAIITSASIWTMASASPDPPAIRNLRFQPSQVTSGGGNVTVIAAIARATTCRLSSTPELAGLPVTVRCAGGSFRRTVLVPANPGAAKAYRFLLRATADRSSAVAAVARVLRQPPFIPLLSWGAPSTIDASGDLDSVSCPTTVWCMAADVAGNVVELNGTSWTRPDPVGAKRVSCPTVSFCAATTFGHSLLTFNGSAWSAPFPVGPSSSTYWAVSCTAAAHCVALGNDGAAIDEDGTWSYKPLGTYAGIVDTLSCPTLSFCMAVGIDASSVAYNGSTWTQAGNVVPPVGATGAMGAVSCAVSRWCMYVGNGSGINSTDEFGYAASYSGRRWSGPVVIEGAGRADPNDVSCLPSGYCVEVDGSGDARTHFRGAWSQLVGIDPKAPDPALEAVACVSMTFCVAVGSSGEAVVGR